MITDSDVKKLKKTFITKKEFKKELAKFATKDDLRAELQKNTDLIIKEIRVILEMYGEVKIKVDKHDKEIAGQRIAIGHQEDRIQRLEIKEI